MTHREPDPITTGMWYGVFALMCLIPYVTIPLGYLYDINRPGIGPTGNLAVIASIIFSIAIRGFSKTLVRSEEKILLAAVLVLFCYGIFGMYHFQNHNIVILCGLVGILGGYGAGLGSFAIAKTGQDLLPYVWRCIVIGAIPLLSLPAFVAITIEDQSSREWVFGMYGFGNIRALGQYTGLAIAVLIFATGKALLTKAKPNIAIHFIFLTGLWSVIAWTGSRAAILSVVIAYAVVYVWAHRFAFKELLVNSIAAVVGIALSTLYAIPNAAFGIVDRVASDATVAQSNTGDFAVTLNSLSSNRFGVWSWTLENIFDHPWMGSGYLFMISLDSNERPSVAHAHNIVLDYMVGFGIPVALSVLILVLTLWCKVMNIVRRTPSTENLIAACVITMLPINSMLSAGLILPFELAIFSVIIGALLGSDLYSKNIAESDKARNHQCNSDNSQETLFV